MSQATKLRTVPRIVLLLLCAAQAMLIIDVVVVNVAIPAIRADLGIPDGRLVLTSISYTLTFGSLLVVFGRAGDLLGRRRLFLAGLTVFTLASLATGCAQAEWQLLAARAAQGAGAAMVAPTALALLTTTFAEGAGRNRALGYWAAVGSAGAIGGQLLGGLITSTLGWRWIFLINVPVGVLAVLAGRRYLTESRMPRHTPLDLRGAVLLATGLATAILALTRFAEGSHPVPGAVLAVTAVVLLSAFALGERRHPDPILDGALLRTAAVGRANLLLAVNAGALAATLFFTTMYLQAVLDYPAVQVGLAFAPVTLVVLIVSPRAGALVSRYGPRALLTAGFLLLAAGMFLLARLPVDGSYMRDALGPLLLLAVGSGLSYAPTFVAGTTGVPDDRQGVASGLLNSAQELGTAAGLAMLGPLAATISAGPGPQQLTDGYRVGLLVAGAAMLACLPLIRKLPSVS
ncbi:MFS transporter [Actinoplanes sp. NBC_00393]|uniref:MFS transporter n=1 Tax=Actinoplanes sp. NBC_00393 TaxID=2975953 RepID=UPI002E21F9BD